MTLIEIAKQVVDQKQCHLCRPRKGVAGEYDAKPYGEGSKRGWFYFDLFSASAIVTVYDALNDQNKAEFAALPVLKMQSAAFRCLK